MRTLLLCLPLVLLAGCADFVPQQKKLGYDEATNSFVPPKGCPDWSHSSSVNYDNAFHSNYGCAVTNNIGQQVADPRDLMQGHGDPRPDTEVTVRAIQQYRAGDIPEPLVPLQSTPGE